jgi:uncharacterized membrane protein
MNRPAAPAPPPPSPEIVRQVELIISRLLRIGVLSSLLTVLIGLVIMFVHHPSYLRAHADLVRLTSVGTAFPHTLRDVGSWVMAGRGRAVVTAGLLLLILTPILRVAVSIVAFIIEKDRIFVFITATVLAVLLLSFLLGKAGSG